MRYFTVERNKISNIYKATEVSEKQQARSQGLVLTTPDSFVGDGIKLRVYPSDIEITVKMPKLQ